MEGLWLLRNLSADRRWGNLRFGEFGGRESGLRSEDWLGTGG